MSALKSYHKKIYQAIILYQHLFSSINFKEEQTLLSNFEKKKTGNWEGQLLRT